MTNKNALLALIKKFSQIKILVVGDVMLDEYIWGKVTRISPEAPVPVVNVHHETMMPGGAANVARNIKSVNAKAALVSVIGDDLTGRNLVRILKSEKVDTKGILKNKNRSTVLKTRVVAHSQQVVRIDKEKNSLPSEKDLVKLKKFISKKIKDIDGVVLEDYGKGIIGQDLVCFLADLCERNDKPLVVDPKKGHILDYTGVTSVTPNLPEALAISGVEYNGDFNADTVKEIGKTIIKKWNLCSLLITLGEHGMMLFEKDGSIMHIPTVAREVYDVSGAGDTVIGIFTTALGCGADAKSAAILSNMAAGIVVGKVGTATVTAEELKEAVISGRDAQLDVSTKHK